MPARGAARRGRRPTPPSYRRVSDDEVRAAALRHLRSVRGRVTSQRTLWRAVRGVLARDEPLAGLTAPRLRRILLATGGLRVDIEYAERGEGDRLRRCPVCGGDVVAITNRTLDGAGTELGQRCPRCGFWTHRRRRRPVRYRYRASPGAAPRIGLGTAPG